jgi:Macrocin-O-methyltransferase (TylF)
MTMTTVLEEVRARIPAVRGRILRPLVRFREMRFPTFSAEIHESIAHSDDYFRYATLGLAATRVLDEEVPGAFAEVRRRVGSSPNVVLRPGYVPDTLAGLEDERFAFVLLDLDLLEPTRASLEFFYPRLSPGGYLVMHDYNNPESDWACKRALDDFLEDRPERLVELGDMWGSALIRRVG